MTSPFHYGFFSSFSPPAWQAGEDRMYGADWWSGEFHGRMMPRVEQACFDFAFFEDTSSITRVAGGSLDADLRFALSSPKNDAIPLLGYLAARTEQLGLVATASTSLYPPYLLARTFATLDNLTRGRIGWNMVTSAEDESAQNFGLDKLPPPQERYDIADEFVDVVMKLWDSWEEGAVVTDLHGNVYTDPAKVHSIDHEGRYFKVRGPLNSYPSPQRQPVRAQAGSSPRGREFAARNAELIFATGSSVEEMKAYVDDLHGRMRAIGRDPRSARILFGRHLYVADSYQAFREAITPHQLEVALDMRSAHLGVDLKSFDLDRPLPEGVEVNGMVSALNHLKAAAAEGRSIRDTVIDSTWGTDDLGLIGPARDVARNLTDIMTEVGGDGWMFMVTKDANERHFSNILDELVPELQALGAMQTSYPGGTFRENLLAF